VGYLGRSLVRPLFFQPCQARQRVIDACLIVRLSDCAGPAKDVSAGLLWSQGEAVGNGSTGNGAMDYRPVELFLRHDAPHPLALNRDPAERV
jgi:hypothetical protein